MVARVVWRENNFSKTMVYIREEMAMERDTKGIHIKAFTVMLHILDVDLVTVN